LRDSSKIAKLLLLVSLTFLASLLQPFPTLKAQPPYVPHSPIQITANSGFTAANGVTAGSGTAADPYIISGWDISASTTHGIEINNTNVFFIIRNVYVHSGVGFLCYPGFDGLLLSHVVNGQIQDSISTQNFAGIELISSSHLQISNNQVYLNCATCCYYSGALTLESTNDTIVKNNNLTANSRYAIVVQSSKNVNVTTNLVSTSRGVGAIGGGTGIWILTSTNLTVTDNMIRYNRLTGLLLDTSTNVHVYHNNFTLNYPNAAETPSSNNGNLWDNGYPSGGNYWDAAYWYYFQAEDNCSGPSQSICTAPDGIGDTPYVLQTGQKDRYPLVSHDAAVVSIKGPIFLLEGKTTTISVTVENLGTVIEKRFPVTLSFGGTQIGTQTLTDFPPSLPTTLTFTWNTGVLLQNGVQPRMYTLTAIVTVALDSNPSNNSQSSAIQIVGFPTTPLTNSQGIGSLLTLVSQIVAIAVLAAFSVLVWQNRKRKAGFPQVRACVATTGLERARFACSRPYEC
jgi:parallel beta-helix repeat protein